MPGRVTGIHAASPWVLFAGIRSAMTMVENWMNLPSVPVHSIAYQSSAGFGRLPRSMK